MEDINGADELT